MKKYIKKLIRLINYERDAEIDLMTHEISSMSGQKREEQDEQKEKNKKRVVEAIMVAAIILICIVVLLNKIG